MTDKLIAAIDSYAEQAHGSTTSGGELNHERALALDAYGGRSIDRAPPGRSSVSDWTVFETVQWILPSLTRIFAGGDNVVEFEPTGPEDEDAAQQESDYLNHLVQKQNWFLTVLTWCQDALITKNAYCLVDMEEKLNPEKQSYTGLSEDQVADLLDDDVEVIGQEIRQEETGQPMMDPMTGEPLIDETGQPVPEMRTLFDIEIKRTKAKQTLKFRVLPPERCKAGEDTPDFTLEECNYFEFEDDSTLTDLRKEGFDVPDDIGDEGYSDNEVDQARDTPLQTDMDIDSPDPSMRQVRVRHVWIRHDTDEDGIAELQYVVLVGREIIHQEEVSRIPVACIVPFLNTHRHMGNSVADLVFDIQRIKTAILRGGLDSLYLSLNPERVISDKVNLDDMLTSRPGGLKRLKSGAIPGEGHVQDLVVPFVFPEAQTALQHMDSVVEARAGVSRLFQGIDESAINDHNRIGQLSSMAAQRVEQIARIFANGFERLFSLAHELIIKSGHQAETVRLRGQWVNIDPTQWQAGRDMTVTAPFAAGNKDALLQRLMIVAGFHEKALAGGLPIVDAQDSYALALEMSKAADLNGEKFFTDPSTVPPKEPPPDYTMLALETENRKVEQSANESMQDNETKRQLAKLDAELDKYKVDMNAELQLALAQIKAGESANLETLRANLRDKPKQEGEQKIKETSEAVQALQSSFEDKIRQLEQVASDLRKEIDAPRELVRDKSGKVTGVRVNGKVRKLQRDKDGNVVGA